MMNSVLAARIRAEVAAGLAVLEGHYRAWAESHLQDPQPITAVVDERSGLTDTLWQVTRNTGQDDAGYRIAYDPETSMFGLVTHGSDGELVLIGLHGDFAKTVVGM